jgi:hypothetical protein
MQYRGVRHTEPKFRLILFQMRLVGFGIARMGLARGGRVGRAAGRRWSGVGRRLGRKGFVLAGGPVRPCEGLLVGIRTARVHGLDSPACKRKGEEGDALLLWCSFHSAFCKWKYTVAPPGCVPDIIHFSAAIAAGSI